MAPAAQLVAEYQAKLKELYNRAPVVCVRVNGQDHPHVYRDGMGDWQGIWKWELVDRGALFDAAGDTFYEQCDKLEELVHANGEGPYPDEEDASYPDALNALFAKYAGRV